MNEDVTTYKECILELLTALDIQDVPLFMSRLKPKNCYLLGKAYSDAVKKKLDERARLIEVLKVARMTVDQHDCYLHYLKEAVDASADIEVKDEPTA